MNLTETFLLQLIYRGAILGEVKVKQLDRFASRIMENQNTSMNPDLQTVSSEDGDDPASRRWLAGERAFNSHTQFLYLRKAS